MMYVAMVGGGWWVVEDVRAGRRASAVHVGAY